MELISVPIKELPRKRAGLVGFISPRLGRRKTAPILSPTWPVLTLYKCHDVLHCFACNKNKPPTHLASSLPSPRTDPTNKVYQSRRPCTDLDIYRSSLYSSLFLLSLPLPSRDLPLNAAKLSTVLIPTPLLVDRAGTSFMLQNTLQIGIKTDPFARQSMGRLKTALNAVHSTRSGRHVSYAWRLGTMATIVSTSTKAHVPILRLMQALPLKCDIS